jgi:hypothetical protein
LSRRSCPSSAMPLSRVSRLLDYSQSFPCPPFDCQIGLPNRAPALVTGTRPRAGRLPGLAPTGTVQVLIVDAREPSRSVMDVTSDRDRNRASGPLVGQTFSLAKASKAHLAIASRETVAETLFLLHRAVTAHPMAQRSSQIRSNPSRRVGRARRPELAERFATGPNRHAVPAASLLQGRPQMIATVSLITRLHFSQG